MRLVLVALTGVLFACGSVPGQPDQTTVDSVDSVDSTAQLVPNVVRSIVLPYATQMAGLFPVVTTNVPSVEALAECMAAQGMSLNGITGEVTSETTIPIDALISPMLTFLLESCSGVPASDWNSD